MAALGEQVTTIALGIVGVAIIAVIVSNKANTANVINAAGSAFAGAIGTAVSPVSGFTGGASPFSGLQMQQGWLTSGNMGTLQNSYMH